MTEMTMTNIDDVITERPRFEPLRTPSALRQIKPMSVKEIGVTIPAKISTATPSFLYIDPRALFIEESYQRTISSKGLRLIAKIVEQWNWSSMKPPVCVKRHDGKIVVLDGQHTAIAASCHPDINQIPIMIVQGDSEGERATSFVDHNRNRIALTPLQLHHAAVAAGDELSSAVNEACALAQCQIRERTPQMNQPYNEGDTIAVNTIAKVVDQHGVAFTAKIMRILRAADRVPISAVEIKAMRLLMIEDGWQGTFNVDDMITAIQDKDAEGWREHVALYIKKGRNMPTDRCLAIAWWQKCKKRRQPEGTTHELEHTKPLQIADLRSQK